MSAAQSDTSSWTRSPWVKWSWLLLLAVIVAQSLNYHWRLLPTSAAGYFARGKADYLHSEFESAIGNLTKSIELEPNDAESYIWRGEAYAKLHDFGKAMPDLEMALQLRPDYEKSHAAAADGKAAAWDAAGALNEYSRALAADPNYARCYLERGKLLYDTERWDDAAADLRRGAGLLLGDNQVTAQLLLWLARAHSGGAAGATAELLGVMKVGRIRGDRFWTSAQFLCGEITEPVYLAAMATIEGGDRDKLQAEAFFLAGVKRLAFGDRAGALTLLQKTLETGADTSYAYDRARVELESLLLGFHAMRNMKTDDGLAIASVTPGGPAEASGIRPGFILTAINGAGASQDAFTEFLTTAESGSTVELQFIGEAGTRQKVPFLLRLDSSEPTR